MLQRYARNEMTQFWSDEARYQNWLDIELLVLKALEQEGSIPEGTYFRIKQKAKFNVKEISDLESTIHHDMIAFLTNVASYVGDDAKYIHMGLTSSDIYDNCFAIQMSKAIKLIDNTITELLLQLKKIALEHKYTYTIGRTHGIHAEPVTFGLKMAQAYAEFNRCKAKLALAQDEISICAISGAVGNYANISPRIEQLVAKDLGFKCENISTQVIPRDRHAFVFAVFGIIAGCMERVATEIRHLQRTEVREVQEEFSEGQKGSSAMPHKRNPVLTENITGLCRVIKSAVAPSIDNIVLWHERDISHSSVERFTGPDITITLDFALNRLLKVIANLNINTEIMRDNIEVSKGTIFSQRVLLGLIDKGMTRDDAYEIVQQSAMSVWDNLKNSDLLSTIKIHPKIKELFTQDEIESFFSLEYYVSNIDHIYKNVFG